MSATLPPPPKRPAAPPPPSGPPKLRYCMMPACRGQRRELVHKFPMNNARCEHWRRLIGEPALLAETLEATRKTRYICHRHFRPQDYKNALSRSLNITAVPSLLLQRPAANSSTTDIDDQQFVDAADESANQFGDSEETTYLEINFDRPPDNDDETTMTTTTEEVIPAVKVDLQKDIISVSGDDGDVVEIPATLNAEQTPNTAMSVCSGPNNDYDHIHSHRQQVNFASALRPANKSYRPYPNRLSMTRRDDPSATTTSATAHGESVFLHRRHRRGTADDECVRKTNSLTESRKSQPHMTIATSTATSSMSSSSPAAAVLVEGGRGADGNAAEMLLIPLSSQSYRSLQTRLLQQQSRSQSHPDGAAGEIVLDDLLSMEVQSGNMPLTMAATTSTKNQRQQVDCFDGGTGKHRMLYFKNISGDVANYQRKARVESPIERCIETVLFFVALAISDEDAVGIGIYRTHRIMLRSDSL